MTKTTETVRLPQQWLA